MTDIDYIISAMENAGVDVDKDFRRLEARGYASDECQALAEEALKDMEAVIYRGINGGYSISMKKALSDLMALVLKLGDRKSAAKITKYINERREIMADVKYKSKTNGLGIKALVTRYAENSELAADVIARRESTSTELAAYMNESKDWLQAIQVAVANVMDDSSKKALECAKTVIADIQSWRDYASRGMATSKLIDFLKNAYDEVQAWAQLDQTISVRNPAADKKDIPEYEVDTVDHIIASNGNVELIRSLNKKVSDYIERTEKLFSVDDKIARKNDYEAKIRDNDAKIKNIFIAYQNGEMDAGSSRAEIESIRDENDYYNEEIAYIKEEIDVANSERRLRLESTKEIRRLADRLSFYEKEDSIMLYYAANNLDVVALVDMLEGNASPDQIEKAVTSMMRVISAQEVLIGNLRTGKAETDAIAEHRRKMNEAMKKSSVKRTPEQNRSKQEDDIRFMQELGQSLSLAEKPKQPQETEGETLSRIINVTNDDK